ncbi:unnamed protein product [Cuscuta epithymum]|uniref:IST1-like protein n=1 Tax=Cuscuta epithymum TaxID=186058 RepID=A0AAV0DCR3_9ASTE|nr:unnamed protein product [Cuscuta epithymum]
MAVAHWKKAMKILSLFHRSFNSSKCKTMARMTTARIKLLRNKREVVVRQMRRDIAMLLESRQDATARIRVEHVIREQNMLAANEIIELFCELIVSRLPIIAKQRECPADLKEGISSLIFAAPRCSEIPELQEIRNIFEKKYGKDFVSEAVDLRPNAGVNRMLIEKLSVKTPSGEVKMKIMKEIAKEYQVEWDTTESEVELLKAPEERIGGPQTFVSATSFPIKQPVLEPYVVHPPNNNHTTVITSNGGAKYEDPESAAKAAAECARQAIAAAEAAAYLTNEKRRASGDFQHHADRDIHAEKVILRRHSCNFPSCNSDKSVKYDESDYDEEIEMDAHDDDDTCSNYESRQIGRRQSCNPCRKDDLGQSALPRVHPKLPDYETLAARFESLKYQKN